MVNKLLLILYLVGLIRLSIVFVVIVVLMVLLLFFNICKFICVVNGCDVVIIFDCVMILE